MDVVELVAGESASVFGPAEYKAVVEAAAHIVVRDCPVSRRGQRDADPGRVAVAEPSDPAVADGREVGGGDEDRAGPAVEGGAVWPR